MLCPDGPDHRLGVKALDDLLEVFVPRPGTAQGQGQTANPRLANRSEPVVEISSSQSAAGKSQLLYYLTAVAILPSRLGDIRLGGRDAAVVFIDADGRFDASRLLTVARRIVQQKMKPQTMDREGELKLHDDIENLLIDSLQHVHAFRPQSSTSLLATLHSLEPYLFNLPRHLSSNRHLHAILIDSMTAFFWQDKLRDQIARIEEIGHPRAEIERNRKERQSFYMADLHAELVKELKRLQHVFGCAVVHTTTAWVGRSSAGDLPGVVETATSFRCPLPAPWGLFPWLRVVVSSSSPSVGGKRRFSGCVNGWAREDWPRRFIEGAQRRNGGRFVFHANCDGVEMAD